MWLRSSIIYSTSQHHTMTLYDSRGTHHVIKCTRPSPSENTPTRNYHLRSMRAWRREKRPGNEAIIFIIIIIFLSKPAISLPEQASALISSPNVSTVDGGVHGHRAFSPYIPTVDRGALPRLTLNDAIYVCVVCRLSACACACIKFRCARRKEGIFCWGFAPK